MSEIGMLSIGHLSTFYHTSFVIMGGEWLEKELDVNTRWTMFGGGPAIVDAFSRSEVDIGYIGLPPVMIGIDRGVPIVCVGGGHVEGTVLIGPPDSWSFEQTNGESGEVLRQFSGGIIGCPPSGSIHDVIIRDLLKKNNLVEDIEVRNFPWADFIPDALADGTVDAAVGTPPLSVAAARVCGAKIIIPPGMLWPWNPSYGIIVSRELLRHHPQLVEGFLQVHEKASNLIREDPDRAAQLVADTVEVVDVDFIRRTYGISPKYCASLPREYIESTMAFEPVLTDLGYIENQLVENDIFEISIIKKIHSTEHHYFS